MQTIERRTLMREPQTYGIHVGSLWVVRVASLCYGGVNVTETYTARGYFFDHFTAIMRSAGQGIY